LRSDPGDSFFHPQTPDGEMKTRCLFSLLPVGQILSAA